MDIIFFLGEPIHYGGRVSLTQRIVKPVLFYRPYNYHPLDESVHYVGLVFLIQWIVEPVHFVDLIIIIPWMNGL